MFAVTDFAGREGSAGIAADISDIEAIREEHRAHDPQPCRHARPADHGGRDLRRRPEAALLQPGVPEALGPRPRLPRQRARQCAAARPAAQRRQDRRAAGMAALEGEPACRLPLRRSAGALVASARRPHHPRRRQPAAQGRRHLGVREPDREDRPRKPLPDGGARAGRDARQSGRRRRRVRAGRPRPPVQPGILHAVGLSTASLAEPARIFRRSARACDDKLARQSRGRVSSPPSPASTTSAATATARPSSIDGTVLRYAVIHLPNGQVMMTFVDVTDSVNVERALKDKNEALQKSDQLKNDFVQHVSYELRSPLTNIIGFTELLQLPDYRAADAAPARICRAYRLVVVGAADHRQRHSRPRDRRCRHHGARHRRGPRRADDRHRGRAGRRPAARASASACGSRRRARRRASTATRTASARSCSIC